VAERLGNEVIEFRNVSKSFGDRLLIDNLSFKVPAGAIVGIIGPNGAGKSTLFKLIAGKEKPDSGEVEDRQDRADGLRRPAPRRTGQRKDRLGRHLGRPGHHQRRQVPDGQPRLCGRFNFNGGDQQKKVGTLSGGERGRLHLAKT
jgi:sulfate-transporting ATPase